MPRHSGPGPKHHLLGSQEKTTVVARVGVKERDELVRLARAHDRTPSREIRRAVRFYLTRYDEADRALREQAEGEQQEQHTTQTPINKGGAHDDREVQP